jgi:hypothetical protein
VLDEKQCYVVPMQHRYRILHTAQRNLNENSDWTFASKHFGITTYYRREKDNSLSIKLEGEMKDVPLFDQICVLKELDLHYTWSPFCTSSLTVADLDKLDIVGWFFIGLSRFGLARDGCFRAIGCDNISEDGTVIITGQGINDLVVHNGIIHPEPEDTYLSKDPIIQKLDIPPVPTRRGSGRMTIRRFEASFFVKDATTATTKIVSNMDPNISFLPQTLLEFVMKHLFGVLVGKLQYAAKKIAKDPIHNEHAILMRNEEYTFYHDWLLPKFQAVCRQRGWDMPTIPAFALSTEQIQAEKQRRDKLGFDLRRGGTCDTTTTSADGIVENLSHVTHVNSEKETISSDDIPLDLLSDISSINDAATVRSRNPLANYLREREAGIKKRKAAEVAAGRRRIATLLQPRELSYDKAKRLDELKRAKCLRLGLPYEKRSVSSLSIDEDEPYYNSTDDVISKAAMMTTIPEKKLTLSQEFTKKLNQQSPRARFWTIFLLIVILFIFLHAEALSGIVLNFLKVKFDKQKSSIISIHSMISSRSWFVTFFEDLLIIFYMFCCAVPHFLLCDLALVYAFDSLELSSKSGSHVKRFYTDNVRLGMAGMSGGIVLISIGQSLFFVGIRFILYCCIQLYHFIVHNMIPKLWMTMNNMLQILIPDQLIQMMQLTSWGTTKIVYTFTVWTSRWTVYLINLQMNLFVRSHFLGRSIEALGKMIMRLVWSIQNLFSWVNNKPSTSWRYAAFDMARTLFSYTSVFLLIVLILFTVSARSASVQLLGKEKKREKQQKYARTVSSLTMDGGLLTSDNDGPLPSISHETSTKSAFDTAMKKEYALSIRQSRSGSISNDDGNSHQQT